jgi:hypothetical protein
LASPAAAQTKADLARAHQLDKEGAKAYGEGRYADAIRAFDEAYHLGGPPFELWNIAKCHLRLDQPEQAGEMLEKYLATPNLPKDDREEAAAQLDQLKKRPSKLTVSSSPSGANVSVDNKPVPGVTPLSVDVPPGSHTVTVSAPTGVPYTHQVEARYGRALSIDAPLRSDAGPRPSPPPNPYEKSESALAIRAAIEAVVPRWGGVSGSADMGFLLLGTYRIASIGRTGAFSIGGMFNVNGDHWGNKSGIRNDVGGKCFVPQNESANAFSLYGLGTASVPFGDNWKIAGMFGAGMTGYAHDELGSDLFLADCDPSTGLQPAFLFGAEIDYAIGSLIRISAFPLTWHLQPAFDGVRSAPRDATGVWMRFGFGIGAGVDL